MKTTKKDALDGFLESQRGFGDDKLTLNAKIEHQKTLLEEKDKQLGRMHDEIINETQKRELMERALLNLLKEI